MRHCPDLDEGGVDAPGKLPQELISSLASDLLGGLVLSGLDVGEVKGELVDPVSESSLDPYYCVVIVVDLEGLATRTSERTSPHEIYLLYLIGSDG